MVEGRSKSSTRKIPTFLLDCIVKRLSRRPPKSDTICRESNIPGSSGSILKACGRPLVSRFNRQTSMPWSRAILVAFFSRFPHGQTRKQNRGACKSYPCIINKRQQRQGRLSRCIVGGHMVSRINASHYGRMKLCRAQAHGMTGIANNYVCWLFRSCDSLLRTSLRCVK